MFAASILWTRSTVNTLTMYALQVGCKNCTICFHLMINLLQSNMEPNTKANFRKRVRPFSLQDGTLFHHHKKHGLLRVVKPEEVNIPESLPQKPLSGHQGVNRKKWKHVLANSWEGCRESCQTVWQMSTTKPVIKSSIILKSYTGELNRAFRMLGMDLVGPPKDDLRGNKHIIIMTDNLTKWLEVKCFCNRNIHLTQTVLLDIWKRGKSAYPCRFGLMPLGADTYPMGDTYLICQGSDFTSSGFFTPAYWFTIAASILFLVQMISWKADKTLIFKITCTCLTNWINLLIEKDHKNQE